MKDKNITIYQIESTKLRIKKLFHKVFLRLNFYKFKKAWRSNNLKIN